MGKRSHNPKMELHNFYCLNCGNRGISLMRKQGYQHEQFHRKKLYCPTCRKEVNHIECKTMEDVEEFLENFKNGVYKDEAEESLAYVGNSGER
jgi:hypothetical protein